MVPLGTGRLFKMALRSLLLLDALSGNGQSHSRVEEQRHRIETLENAWNQALQSNDTKAVEPLMSADLIYIEYTGAVKNKAQYLASIKAPGQRIEHVVSESMQVQVFSLSAVVIGLYSESGTVKGKTYSRRERFVDTWVSRDGAWLCVTSQSTLISH